ncbi:MAG: hypothetical protein C0597_07995, partial [Marinilabiliales bacterium]
MKKLYLLLLTLIGSGILLCLFFFIATPKSDAIEEALTPKQIWDAQYKYKHDKRERGEVGNKTDKPNEFTKYFRAITTKFNETDNSYPINYRVKEYLSAKSKRKGLKLGLNNI